jgi:hypothetical protein
MRSARILKFAKFTISKAMRLIIDSVASIGRKGWLRAYLLKPVNCNF